MLSKQEQLFFNRVHLKMLETGQDILGAAKSVCDDDVRILNTYSRMPDHKQAAFKGLFVSRVYDRLKKGA